MTRVAWLFPGQGSQFVGMGKELSAHPDNQAGLNTAEKILGFSLQSLMEQGPEATLKMTAHTQPAILMHSWMVLTSLRDRLPMPHFVAGHSLGEYSACVASGVLTFEDALRTVYQRGKAMQSAVPEGQGTMAAMIGMSRDDVKACCETAIQQTGGTVAPANFNGPGQIVIAGHTEAVRAAIEEAKKIRGKRAIELPVSAPFHSSLMSPARQVLTPILEALPFRDATVPLIQNVNALPTQDGAQLREGLIQQIDHSVLWEDTVDYLLNVGVTTFIECGPGKVLSGLVKRQALDRQREGIASLSIGTEEDLALLN